MNGVGGVPGTLDAATEGFARLCDSLPVPMAIVELRPDSTTVVRANVAMEQLFGVASLVGRTLGEFTDPDELLDDMPARTRIIEGAMDAYGRAKRYRRADGASIDVQVFGVVLQPEGDRHFALGVFQPAPESLRRGYRTESQLAMVLSDIQAALLRGDADSAVLELICRSACRLLEVDHAGVLMLEDPDTLRLAAVDRGPESQTVFFFNDAATTEIYPLSLPDALPI